ncbi:MAG: TIGR01459 family HAD-type hydrolase [Rhodospirillales bacterium]|nr:TIGR01459 family HAD-type hydrolase [Rhodospirillales bacterium]MCB9996396.1 TIGR01459 family HAD-type hydrolase [Rhodospirillales bacterium]
MSIQNDSAAPPPLLQGLGDIAAKYDHFILDIWGVLHNGIKPFPGTIACLQNLKSQGKKICLVSNTPDSSSVIAQRLAEMGISRDLYDKIITAGDSAHDDIKTRSGQKCWYAGNRTETCLLDGIELDLVDGPEDADFIVNDLYALSDEEKQALIPLYEKAIAKNLPMICGNPDLIVNVGDDVNECPGTYARLYEEMGGTVIYHGKPHKPIYDTAWELLGKPDKSRLAAVGDSLHTDIQGANGFGITGIFNLAGIHREEILHDINPDEIDPKKLKSMIDAQPHKPDMILNGFRW